MNASRIFCWFLLLLGCHTQAQISIKTMVPQDPIGVGDAFRVQYVVSNTDRISKIYPLQFPGFRMATGPDAYAGHSQSAGRTIASQNITFTLQALRTGRFGIPAITVEVDGVIFTSEPASVVVVSQQEAEKWRSRKNALPAADNPSFLAPGEDPLQKIKQNLFVKVLVDRDHCVPGQPVVATFKLYSRLSSQSDIIKYPAFYGFAVQDMVDLSDKQVDNEEINGKLFAVHTMRAVQLYPLRPGDYQVDEMRIANKVSFSKTTVSAKTEQEISEGMFGGNADAAPDPNAVSYDYEIVTQPIRIKVNPLPAAGKPDNFTGAVGKFSIAATVSTQQLDRNQEGILEIKITGAGNFSQLGAPDLKWPDGVDAFQPRVKEVIDIKTAPVSGSKIFRFPFVVANAGSYELPACTFSFFDPDSNKYRRLKTEPITIAVSNERYKAREINEQPQHTSISDANRRASIIAGAVILVAVMMVLFYWLRPRRKEQAAQQMEAPPPAIKLPDPQEAMQPVRLALDQPDAIFYRSVQKAIWDFFQGYFPFSALHLKKTELHTALQQSGWGDADYFYRLLTSCEEVIYTGMQPTEDREELIKILEKKLEEFKARAAG